MAWNCIRLAILIVMITIIIANTVCSCEILKRMVPEMNKQPGDKTSFMGGCIDGKIKPEHNDLDRLI